MKDIFGTKVEAGDIIALGIRSGNVGGLTLRVVIDPETRKVKGWRGGTGRLGEHNNSFVKLETSQLQNPLGYQMLDMASEEKK